jgi:hypothetical protein
MYFINKIHIIKYLVIGLFCIGFVSGENNNAVNIDHFDASSEHITVIQPCSMYAGEFIDDHKVLDEVILITSCKGNYAHCGNDVWSCPRFDDAIFACCHLSSSCPRSEFDEY